MVNHWMVKYIFKNSSAVLQGTNTCQSFIQNYLKLLLSETRIGDPIYITPLAHDLLLTHFFVTAEY